MLCPGREFLPKSEHSLWLSHRAHHGLREAPSAPAWAGPRVPRWPVGAPLSPRATVASQGMPTCIRGVCLCCRLRPVLVCRAAREPRGRPRVRLCPAGAAKARRRGRHPSGDLSADAPTFYVLANVLVGVLPGYSPRLYKTVLLISTARRRAQDRA